LLRTLAFITTAGGDEGRVPSVVEFFKTRL
jgi:hypothetical protein